MGLFGSHARVGASAAGGYEVERSLRFEPNDSTKLERIPSSTGNQKVWTWSGWVKRTKLGKTDHLFGCDNDADGNNNGIAGLYFNNSDDKLHTYFDTSGTAPYGAINDRVYRDTSSWYHIVWKVDAVNTETKIWVNGVEETVASGNMPPNYAYHMNEASFRMNMGVDAWDNSTYCNLYFAEVHYCDGQEYQASDFGETDADTGQWIPKEVTGLTYGTNGFYLNFSDNSNTTAATLGKDSSGNGNNWTPTNFSVSGAATDSFEDTPTNNFPILNWNQTGDVTDDRIHSGGLAIDWQDSHNNRATVATMGMPSGKWYFEILNRSDSGAQGSMNIGIFPDDYTDGKRCQNTNAWPGGYTGSGIGFTGSDQYYLNGSNQGTYGGTWAENDIIGMAVDVDTGKIALSKNGQWADGSGNYDEANINSQKDLQGVAPYFFAFGDSSGSSDPKITINFGQRAFSHSIPSGYKKLCSKNLPVPTIKNGREYFNSILYTATGVTNRTLTGVGFSPNLGWFARRNTNGAGSMLFDTVRGATKELYAPYGNGEDAVAESVKSFDADGYTLGNNWPNAPGTGSDSWVAWNWKEAVSAGFDIVKYNGDEDDTISHSLGVSPRMMIIKSLESSNDWMVWHVAATNASNKVLNLNNADAVSTSGSNTFIKAVSASNFTLGSSALVQNGSSNDYIAYLFSSVEGYSKVDSYTGNGNADGPFVYTGFRPAWILVKNSSRSAHWGIYDVKRKSANENTYVYQPNLNDAEDTSGHGFDLLSNGFKVRSNGSPYNHDGEKMIYLAFAERPFRYANAR